MLTRFQRNRSQTDYAIEVLDSICLLDAFLTEWHATEASLENIHFYQNLEQILIRSRYSRRDLKFRIIVLRLEHQIHCIAPLIEEPRLLPLKLGTLKLAKLPCKRFKLPTGRVIFTEIANAPRCIQQLISLPSSIIGANCLFLEELRLDEAEAVQNLRSRYTLRQINHSPQGIWVVKIEAEYDQFLATLSSKTRNEIRRKFRRFTEAATSWELKTIHRPEQIAEFVYAQQYVYQRSWKSNTQEPSRKNSLSFNVEYLQHIAERGWLRCYVLYCDETPAAYSINFQYKTQFYGQEMAYDKHLGRLAPGLVLLQQVIKDLHQVNSPTTMNLGFGDSVLKKQICPPGKLASNAYLVRRFTFASGVIEIQYGLSKIYHRFRQISQWMNVDTRLRKMLK